MAWAEYAVDETESPRIESSERLGLARVGAMLVQAVAGMGSLFRPLLDPTREGWDLLLVSG